jgi:hypothetical protein
MARGTFLWEISIKTFALKSKTFLFFHIREPRLAFISLSTSPRKGQKDSYDRQAEILIKNKLTKIFHRPRLAPP